MYAAILKIVYV